MGDKVMQFLWNVLAGFVLIIIAYIGFHAWASWQQGYTWQEMDWHQRGSTSVIDFFVASDIGKRNIVHDGIQCIEYYAYKDGLPIKMVCHE